MVRHEDRGLKNWFFGKNRGLKNWILTQYEALELKFCKIWGLGTEIFVKLGSSTVNLVKFVIFAENWVLKNWNMLTENGGLRELLREREKGVLRTADSRTPFQGE